MSNNRSDRYTSSPAADVSLEECLGRMSAGDEGALGEFYHRTRAAVYGYALSLLKNAHDAEDVLQECYLKLCADPTAYRAEGKPMAYLLRIVRNLCLDRLRFRQRKSPWPQTRQISLPPGRALAFISGIG